MLLYHLKYAATSEQLRVGIADWDTATENCFSIIYLHLFINRAVLWSSALTRGMINMSITPVRLQTGAVVNSEDPKDRG